MKQNINKLTKMSILVALSIVLLMLVRFPFSAIVPVPGAQYYEYDAMDIPILIGSFIYGPLAGLLITLVSSVIQGISFSSGSGWVGILMHFIATGTLCLTAGTIYKFKKDIKGAVIGLAIGTIAMALIMIPANLVIVTTFFGFPKEQVEALILPVIIPFNLFKAGVNCIITFLIYKPLKRIIKWN